jgi:Mrp family chromosome partitioning ATPase
MSSSDFIASYCVVFIDYERDMSEHREFSSLEKTSRLKQGSKDIEETESERTQTAIVVPQELSPKKRLVPNDSTAVPPPLTMYVPAVRSAKRPMDQMQVLRARCRQLGVSLFFHEQVLIRRLGFTSSISGEGKTFLAKLTAEVMAEDNDVPVTLLECNWENPTLSTAYNLAPNPGLSDWLLGRCPLRAIRREVARNLTVIPAGDDSFSATKLLRQLQQKGVNSLLASPDEVLVLDLPAVATTAYGPLAAHLAEALVLVVRMGVTPEPFVTEACKYLKDLPVHGIVLNQVVSRIPRWLRRML